MHPNDFFHAHIPGIDASESEVTWSDEYSAGTILLIIASQSTVGPYIDDIKPCLVPQK